MIGGQSDGRSSQKERKEERKKEKSPRKSKEGKVSVSTLLCDGFEGWSRRAVIEILPLRLLFDQRRGGPQHHKNHQITNEWEQKPAIHPINGAGIQLFTGRCFSASILSRCSLFQSLFFVFLVVGIFFRTN